MKNLLPLFVAALMMVACTGRKATVVTITNDQDFDRVEELVEVTLGAEGLPFGQQTYCLTDDAGNAVPYQVMYYGQSEPQSIVFQVTLPASQSISLTWKECKAADCPAPERKVYARHVPERKDDFAWENDRAAYRMYGPALAAENPSNGVDLWFKGTSNLIVDEFYLRALDDDMYYHRLRPEGLDCYKVGDKLGCGGVAPLVGGQLCVGSHYDHWELLESGPLRTIFRLDYDNYPVPGGTITESLTVTVDAGAQLNKAQVTYGGNLPRGMKVAAGIYLHDTVADMTQNLPHGWIAYAENGITQTENPEYAGRSYAAVVMPGATELSVVDNTLLLSRSYTAGDTLTYWFGGGWDHWYYRSDSAWTIATDQTAACIAHPLMVQVSEAR